MQALLTELTVAHPPQDDREAGDEDSATEVAEILLRLQDNLHVNPRSRRYTTRNATGAVLLSCKVLTSNGPFIVASTAPLHPGPEFL